MEKIPIKKRYRPKGYYDTVEVAIKIGESKRFRPWGKKRKKKYDRRADVYREMMKEIKNCEECGSTFHLCVHHIDKDRHNNQRSNLQKLCLDCHIEKHKDEAIVRVMRKRREVIMSNT